MDRVHLVIGYSGDPLVDEVWIVTACAKREDAEVLQKQLSQQARQRSGPFDDPIVADDPERFIEAAYRIVTVPVDRMGRGAAPYDCVLVVGEGEVPWLEESEAR